MLTSCSAPRTGGCDVAAAIPPTRTELLVVDGAGPDLTLPGEAAAAFEPGVLTYYELDGCSLVITVSKSGSDLVVDTL